MHTPPGSLPIELAVGAISTAIDVEREMPQLVTSMTLEMDIESYDEAALKAELSALYGVPASLIGLNVTGGSLTIAVTLGARSAESREALARRVRNEDDSALSMALGVAATRAPTLALGSGVMTVREVVQRPCRPGFWCTAGSSIACTRGTFNRHANADNATACVSCPLHATTLFTNSTAAADCGCEPGFYQDGERCAPCPIGTDCSALFGVTLRVLPLKRGYYRSSPTSVDVRRCPDASANCTLSECDGGLMSGCLGEPTQPCADGLTGHYCSACFAWSRPAHWRSP